MVLTLSFSSKPRTRTTDHLTKTRAAVRRRDGRRSGDQSKVATPERAAYASGTPRRLDAIKFADLVPAPPFSATRH